MRRRPAAAPTGKIGFKMRELMRTNDVVLMSYVLHLLQEAGIECLVFDGHTSAVEGSIGALPRRMMVEDSKFHAAKRELSNASITICDT